MAGIHLLASAVVAGTAAAVVFALWYPPPYAAISGGLSLFLLLVSIDVVLGPALTAVIADPDKPRASLRRDLSVIVIIQVIGLGYGVYVIAMARPVYQVFEVDRMRVVTASDIDPDTLREAVPELQRLPWFGPGVIAAAKPTNPDEVLRSIDLALAGFDIAQFPRHWRPFSSQSAQAWSVARPVAKLVSQYPDATPDLQRIAASANQPADTLRFLPLVSRHASWVTVIAAPDARIVGYLPVDGFF